jgi:putative ABC transport system permease protein
VLLGLVGGGLGLLLALVGVRVLTKFGSNIPRVDEIGVDTTVLCFTVAISMITGVVFGLVPALQSSRTDLTESLKDGGKRSSGQGAGNRLRSLLVVSEVAFALILLTGAGLLLKSFSQLQGVGLGFNPKGVVTFDVQLSEDKYKKPEQMANFFSQTLEQIKTVPGVEDAAATLSIPLSGGGPFLIFYAEGQPARGPEDYTAANFNPVSPDYFRTLAIPILRGRDISRQDTADSPPVVVVSQSLAKRFFPGQDAIGKRIKLSARPDSQAPWITLVGIVGDTKQNSIEEKEGEATMYVPYLQMPQPVSAFVLRAAGDLTSLSSGLKNAVSGVDKDQPIANIKTMDHVLLEYNAQRRLIMLLLVIFACLAVLLASIGVYGVMAYSVTERSHELGIRLALGAKKSAVLSMIIRQGLLLALGGVALGLVAAFGLTRLMSSLLFNVTATDPLVFVAVALTITAVAMLACLLPAVKATRVDPMVMLRYE